MTASLAFEPLLPWAAVGALAALAALGAALAVRRGARGWWLRALALAAVVLALAGPVLERERREGLGDILLVLIDESASQTLPGRPEQTDAALTRLRAAADRQEGLTLRVTRVGDAPEDGGTRLMSALTSARADIPEDRLAGVVAVTDGRIHDMEAAPEALPAPFQVLLTGREDDWDLRLEVERAPPYAIVGEEAMIEVAIRAEGEVPERAAGSATLSIAEGTGPARSRTVPVGETVRLPVEVAREGRNLVRLSLDAPEGQLTERNDSAVVTLSGVRERMRVLLVTGKPGPGTRSWRNILKSDGSVDLVHFTILRPPSKQDATPVSELSLIAFPTRELFLEKIDGFDLIIFDRYVLSGILPGMYLDNVRSYVEGGGAVLVSAGPDFATAASLARSPLGRALPAAPTGRVVERTFRPALTGTGRRHPVTADLDRPEAWGRWTRQVAVSPKDDANVLISGPEEAPLLTLGRVGEGRTALLASDQAWLWDRGHEGGGPLGELLRRLSHWMMKAPRLEEEALTATGDDGTITVTRRSLTDAEREATITGPDGDSATLTLAPSDPGRWSGEWAAPGPGLYTVREGGLSTVVALGAANAREYADPVADSGALAPLAGRTGGAVTPLSTGTPELRAVRAGRSAEGRGWIGYTPRGAYVTLDVTRMPLAPAWAMLLLAAGLAVAGWLREARRV